jgi:drug/metabolite transporter (DMT)-like permease
MFDLRLLFVAVVWGINFSVVKYALADFHPLSFTVVRFFFAALFLLSVMVLTREPAAIDRRDRFPIVRLGFIGITVYNIFFMLGLKYTTVSHSALFISMSPLVAALIQAATGRERITLPAVTGLGIAFLGVVTIIRTQHGEFSFSSNLFLGDVLTLCGTVTWALYTVTARPLLERYSALKVTAYNMAAGTVLLAPIALPDLLRQDWGAIPVKSWLALFFTAFISAGVAFSLWYQGVKRIGVTRTMVYHYLMPFAAVLFAAFFLDEQITLRTALGGVSILAGIALVQRMHSSRP